MVFKLIDRESDGFSHIHIYDDIDPLFGFSVNDLRNDLAQLKPDETLVVHINSAGGSVFEGIAIYNILKMWKGNVITIVEGIAASMASVVMLAGKKRKMFDNAQVMVHDPLFSVKGNIADLEKAKDLLENAGTIIRGIYKSNLRASETEIDQWLKDETYLTAEQALAAGFVSEIIVPPRAVAKADYTKLVARLLKGNVDMEYAQWLADQCAALGLDAAKLTSKQEVHFKSLFDAAEAAKLAAKGGTKPPPLPGKEKDPPVLEDSAELEAREVNRQNKFREVIAKFTGNIFKMNPDAVKAESIPDTVKSVGDLHVYALRNKWSLDKLELTLHKVTMTDVGAAAIHQGRRPTLQTPKAISCAILRACGNVPSREKHKVTGKEYGWETMYDKETLDASDHPILRDISLLQIFDMMHVAAHGHRYEGNLKTDAFLAAARESVWKLKATGNTTWTGLNIFDDAMSKTLLSAYQMVNTTWQEWVHQRSVPDFKTANMYRLTHTGTYQMVGADGELAHGGFTDQKFTHSADTYGKIVGITRRELINDDLGALSGVMAALGMEAGLFLEELFWVYLLSRLATLFPTNNANANYVSGAGSALSVDGLTLGETMFGNQVNADFSPILQRSTIILAGTNNSVLASELFTKTAMSVLQTANAKGRPDENPHVGKFRPVISPFMNNTAIKRRITAKGTAIPGQTQTGYILLGPPNEGYGGIVIGSFLNNRKTPIIEQGDPDFNVLGLQWRAYHDVGADDGDPKLAVFVKGAA